MRFIAQLLILGFLLLTNSRVLFVKREKKDVIVVLAPLSLFLSLLLIFAWGVDFVSIYLVFLSILVILSNFHALFRYSANLYVDHYSGLMMFWAFITIMLSVFGIVVIILFFPGHLSGKKLNVEETKYYYEGSFRNGFSEKTLFGKTNVIVTEYTKVGEQNDEDDALNPEEAPELPQNVILLIPDKRGDTQAYTEYLQLLAQEGNRVFSADFFTEDAKYLDTPGETRYTRQFLFVLYQLLGRTDFYSQKEKLTFNVTQEIEGVLDILEKDFEITGPVFLVTDEMSAPAGSLYKMKNRQKISGSFNLASASAYQTPGYGFITFNNPLVAKLLGYSADRSKSQLEDTIAETIKTMVK
jgi:hypothetical protein